MLSLRVNTSFALTAVPSVAVVFRVTRIVGVVSFVLAAALSVGALGAVLSSAWPWALEIAVRLVEVLMAVEASAIALCAAALTVAEALSSAVPNMLVMVVESAKFTTTVLPSVVVVSLAVASTVARLAITLAPALADALSARATMVATWAAAFCAATALLAAVASVDDAAAIGS